MHGYDVTVSSLSILRVLYDKKNLKNLQLNSRSSIQICNNKFNAALLSID